LPGFLSPYVNQHGISLFGGGRIVVPQAAEIGQNLLHIFPLKAGRIVIDAAFGSFWKVSSLQQLFAVAGVGPS
jgi:hypothetical protein